MFQPSVAACKKVSSQVFFFLFAPRQIPPCVMINVLQMNILLGQNPQKTFIQMEAEDEITTLLIQTPLLSWWQPRESHERKWYSIKG